jgi:hypothetical protein
MKKKDLVEIRCFFNEYLKNQKLTKRKKAKIESYISIIDSSLKHKDPVKYFLILISAGKVIEELIKLIVEFFKPK